MKKETSKKNETILPFENDLDFMNKWKEWLQFRKERRLPNYVPTGLRRTFEKLIRECGSDPKVAVQMIDQSIGNNWQGIFPLKSLKNGKSTINEDKLKKTIAAHIGGW